MDRLAKPVRSVSVFICVHPWFCTITDGAPKGRFRRDSLDPHPMLRADDIVVRAENVGKRYRLGVTDRRQFIDEFKALMYRLRGKADPTVPVDAQLDSQRIGADFWALRDISFEVRRGEVLGIIGRNGAGKSTLLKLLSRITLPTEGRIGMKGKVSSLLEVGTGFHPELTGRDNIYLNGAILGMRRSEVTAKLADIIAFSGIQHHIDTPVKRYSSGMRVRLGFAVAAHLEPEILIVDEVLSVGDAEFQRKSMGKMKASAASGRTVLFVSHNMTAMRSLCDRVIWLENGRLRMNGTTQEVVSAYLNHYSEDRNEVLWKDPTTAPGNALARLHYVRVKPASGRELFTWEEAVEVEMGFENLTAEADHLNVNVQVLNSDEQVLFTTNFRENMPNTMLSLGTHHLRFTIPGNLLNSGTFYLNVRSSYKAKQQFSADGAVNFTITEPQRNGTWMGKRPGFFRMPLPWLHRSVLSKSDKG
jgi:lipopolysaccharide transport system ATP-binding protein